MHDFEEATRRYADEDLFELVSGAGAMSPHELAGVADANVGNVVELRESARSFARKRKSPGGHFFFNWLGELGELFP